MATRVFSGVRNSELNVRDMRDGESINNFLARKSTEGVPLFNAVPMPQSVVIHIYADAGHAWGKVPKWHLDVLGIRETITEYSYQNGDFAYLEEDCDLTRYINALTDEGITYRFREASYSNTTSKVRSYPTM